VRLTQVILQLEAHPAMQSFHLFCVLFHVALSTASRMQVLDGQTATLITFPPAPTDTGLKQIPDAAHPFIAPGPNDQRGRELPFCVLTVQLS
jgi:hypothetical protein